MSNTTATAPPLELAHVLFTDIVAFSKLSMDQQERMIALLQELVRDCSEYQRAQAAGQLISLPTGDGMALVFFGDPESAVRCAQELNTAIRLHPELKLRMGVHSGPVYRVSDINADRNVTGGGINMAQRVMDCGDAGHLLVSKSTADFLFQVGNWAAALHDLGEAEVKHGVKLHIYNFYRPEVGNAERPSKLRVARRKQRTRFGAWITAVAVVVAAIGAFFWMRAHEMSVNVGIAPVRRSVAVLGFKNLSGKPDQAWLSTALAQMLSTELAAGQRLRTVPGESVAQAKLEFAIPDVDSLAPETLTRLKKRLGADLVVLGSYVELGGGDKNLQIRLDVRLQNADDGEVLVATSANGAVDNLFGLIARCGQELRSRLNIGGISKQQASEVRAALPNDPEAARLYAEGIDRLRVFDALGARDLLLRSVEVENNNAMSHAALANAWLKLGYQAAAVKQAKQALDLAGSLSREDHLRIEGQYHNAQSDWAQSMQTYEALFGFFPDNLEYGLGLAYAQTKGGKNQECLQTIERLRKLPAPSHDDPRIDLVAAQAQETMGDSRAAAALNDSAAQKAKAIDAQFMYAQALTEGGWNYRMLGQHTRAIQMFREAQKIFLDRGDRASAARALGNMGATLAAEGNQKSADDAFQQALAVDREIGYTLGQSRMLQNLGFSAMNQGKLAEAHKAFEESLSISRTNGDQEGVAATLFSISDLLYQMEDRANARKYVEEAAELAHAINDKRLEATARSSLAEMLVDDGELADAKSNYEDGLKIFRQQGAPVFILAQLQRLGSLEWSQGDFRNARLHLEEAVKIARELGKADDITLCESLVAGLDFDEEKLDVAIPALRSVIADFGKEQAPPENLTDPTKYLAQAMMATGNYAEARKLLDGLREKDGRYPTPTIEAYAELARAHDRDARPAIAAVQRLLASKRFIPFESRLELRLVLARLQVDARNQPEARSQLAALQKDADAKGYGLWSRKAGVLLKTL